MRVEVLADGLGWPEGPSLLPDGAVAFVETYRSRVSVWEHGSGCRALADTAGGPCATALGSDGHLYVTQDGGVAGAWRAERMCPPSIQRVTLAGRVETVCTELGGTVLAAPNDLAFGPDGNLYFTDPGGGYDPASKSNPGRICVLRPDGSGEVLIECGATFPNGIAVEPDGSVVWSESYTGAIRRRRPDGRTELVANPGHVPDGLAVDTDERIYVTAVDAAGIDVVAADGSEIGFLAVGTVPTNCVFDGATLYVTDGGEGGNSEVAVFGGSLFRVELTVDGRPLFYGRVG